MPEEQIPIDSTPVNGRNDELLLSLFPEVKDGFGFDTMSSDDTIPEEILEFLGREDIKLPKRSFRCLLKISNGDNDAKGHQIKAFDCRVPTIEWITNHYGPARYILTFLWQKNETISDTDGKRKQKKTFQSHDEIIEIPEVLRDEYEEFQFQKRLERKERQRRRIDKARLNNAIDGDTGGDVMDKVREISENAKLLGFSPANNTGGGWKEILPLITPMLPSLFQMLSDGRNQAQQQNQVLLTTLMQSITNNNQNMVEMAKATQQPQGVDMMKQITEMIVGAVDMKELLAGPKESALDKVLKLAESVAPTIGQMVSMSAAQRSMDPRIAVTKGIMNVNPAVQEVMDNPEEQIKFIQRWDEKFGWEQTDLILEVAGVDRPDSTPRHEHQRLPVGSRPQEAAPEQNPVPEQPQQPQNQTPVESPYGGYETPLGNEVETPTGDDTQ